MTDPQREKRPSVSAMHARPGVMDQPPATWPPPLCVVCGKDAATHLGFTRIVTCGAFQGLLRNISPREEGSDNG